MDVARLFEDKKFMWDGRTYESESEALKGKEDYEKDKFETRLISEEEKYYLFTRRVVTEIVVEGQPLV